MGKHLRFVRECLAESTLVFATVQSDCEFFLTPVRYPTDVYQPMTGGMSGEYHFLLFGMQDD